MKIWHDKKAECYRCSCIPTGRHSRRLEKNVWLVKHYGKCYVFGQRDVSGAAKIWGVSIDAPQYQELMVLGESEFFRRIWSILS